MEALEPNSAETERKPIDLMFGLRIIVRRRWVILATAAAVIFGIGLYTLRQAKVYRATTSMIIDATAPRYLDNQVQEVVDSGSGNYWYAKEHYETQYKVIVSRAVSKRVVEKLGLDNDLAFLGLTKIKDPLALKSALSLIDPVAILQTKIKAQPVKDSRLVYVVIEDFDSDRAALLANEVAQAYIAENLALKLRTTDKASEWLEEQLKDLEHKSRQSEMSVYQFKKDADMLTTSLEDRQSMVSQRLNAVNLALTEVRTKLAGQRARVDAIGKLRNSKNEEDAHWAEGLSSGEDNVLIHQLKIRYAAQKVECAELKDRYLAEHPKLAACTEKLSSTKQDLVHELSNLVRAAETDLVEATMKERNLGLLLDAAKAEAFVVNKKQIEFNRINRDAENNQRLYDLVLKRLKDIELSGLLRTSNVRVLDPARAEKVPVRPNVRFSLILAVVLGLVSGVAFAFTLEYLDNSIGNQVDIEQKLGIPFLGFVPKILEDSGPNLEFRDLHVHRQPKSAVAECCRAIRTNLLFMSPDHPFKTMLVSSSGPQEGKSTTVISLGIAMAQSGNRVLVVDTDMRRPRLHKAFGVPDDRGVTSVLVSESSLEDALKSTEVPGLFVLPCGPIPPNPAELLHTQAFSELLKKLIAKFDRVILDSPPLAAVADAAILATQVDGVVLVVKARHTPRDIAIRGIRSLRDVNAKIYGAILNNVDLEDPKYGDYLYAYRHYGHYYGQGKDEHAEGRA